MGTMYHNDEYHQQRYRIRNQFLTNNVLRDILVDLIGQITAQFVRASKGFLSKISTETMRIRYVQLVFLENSDPIK